MLRVVRGLVSLSNTVSRGHPCRDARRLSALYFGGSWMDEVAPHSSDLVSAAARVFHERIRRATGAAGKRRSTRLPCPETDRMVTRRRFAL